MRVFLLLFFWVLFCVVVLWFLFGFGFLYYCCSLFVNCLFTFCEVLCWFGFWYGFCVIFVVTLFSLFFLCFFVGIFGGVCIWGSDFFSVFFLFRFFLHPCLMFFPYYL